MNYLADIAWMKGEFTQWLGLISEILASARQRNDANSSLYALGDLATVRLLLGQAKEALEAIQTGFSLLPQSSDPKFEMFLCARLIQVHLQQGEVQRAEQALERGMHVASQSSSTLISAAASGALASATIELWEVRGRPTSELGTLTQFVKQSYKNARGDWRPIAQPLLWRLRGWEAYLSGKPTRAQKLWRKSLAVAERLKIPHETALTHYVLGKHELTIKRRHAHLQKAAELFERLGAVVDLEKVRHALNAQP
jgi:tetratricopeptide (TPR) repeat protein